MRALGKLSNSRWDALLHGWKGRAMTSAWVPRVVSEVAGTNLDQACGLQRETLEEVVRAVRRFDELADRTVLPDEHEIMRQALHALAGLGTSPRPPGDEGPVLGGWRTVLDHALLLDSVHLVMPEVVKGQRRLILKNRRDPDRGVAVIPARSFESRAPANVNYWRRRTRCRRGAPAIDRIREIVEFLPEYVRSAAKAPEISVPIEVARSALSASSEQIFGSPLGYRCVVESWYLHLRATGDKVRITNNDMADIVIASYIPYGRVFVTDDGDLRALLGEVVADPRTIMDFETMFRNVTQGEAPGL